MKLVTELLLLAGISLHLCDGKRPALFNWERSNSTNDQSQKSDLDISKETKDLEVHEVVTEDGYILTIHRLPGSTPGSIPVFLVHGFLESSTCWLVPGKRKSLPHILLNNGYDVWLGNLRGNTYSKKHVTLSTSDLKFWDFGYDEYGYYDVPASINYITKFTNSSLHYVSHSAGAAYLTMAMQRPLDIHKKVKTLIGLAPAVYANHSKTNLRILVSLRNLIKLIFGKFLRVKECFGRSFFLDLFANTVCKISSTVCASILFFADSVDFKELNRPIVPDIFRVFPAGVSLRCFDNFLQVISYDEFRKQDFGPKENLKKYGTENSPIYNISKTDVPVAVFWGENDHAVVHEDALRWYQQVPKKLGIFKVEEPLFNHIDFLWAKHADKLVYNHVLEILKKNN